MDKKIEELKPKEIPIPAPVGEVRKE